MHGTTEGLCAGEDLEAQLGGDQVLHPRHVQHHGTDSAKQRQHCGDESDEATV